MGADNVSSVRLACEDTTSPHHDPVKLSVVVWSVLGDSLSHIATVIASGLVAWPFGRLYVS